MTEHVSSAMGDLVVAARALAAKNGLERDGTIWCWACEQRPALMPSLHCHLCLVAEHKRLGIIGTCINRPQTPADVEAARVPT
jgi:hypothetical protein